MPFQPLGYRFEVRSPMTRMEAKAALRRAGKRWMDPKNGARGWVFGSIVCLWWSSLDPQGPMIIGRLHADGAGSRVCGRAGSDLNGTLSLLIVTPILVVLVAILTAQGATNPVAIFTTAIIVCIALPFALWIRSSERRHADSLVRFVGRALKSKEPS